MAVVVAMTACDGATEKERTPQFDISGAVAVGRVNRASQPLTSAVADLGTTSGSSELMKVDAAGEVSSAGTAADIVRVDAVKGGVLISMSDSRKYLARLDGSQVEIPVATEFVGENDAGDLVFRDASVYRLSTGTVETLRSVMEEPTVDAMSGNFLLLWSHRPGTPRQIYDSITTKRYNIQDCGGFLALSSSRAFVNDCGNSPIIDMETGTRSGVSGSVTMLSINGEALTTSNGAFVISQGCPGSVPGEYSGELHICKIAPSGEVTPVLSTVGVQPSGGCLACGRNKSFFGWGNYLVVRELNQVSKIEIGTDAKVAILAGYNVANVAVVSNLVYYLAEDSLGNPVAGMYDLSTGANTAIEGAAAFRDLVPVHP